LITEPIECPSTINAGQFAGLLRLGSVSWSSVSWSSVSWSSVGWSSVTLGGLATANEAKAKTKSDSGERDANDIHIFPFLINLLVN